MDNTFQDQLSAYVEQAKLSVRRVALQAGIPHQTLHNWLKGRRPRWHPDLDDDLSRLGQTLGLNDIETENLLLFAGCVSARTVVVNRQDNTMKAKHDLPEGWIAAGRNPKGYDMVVDKTTTYKGQSSLMLATEQEGLDFGTVMQTFKADNYVGKRLRYRAMVRTADVDADDNCWAGLWMRVDREDNGKFSAFDNMKQRAITGTTEWAEYEIVLDVAEDSGQIAFGMLLIGKGQAWMSNIRFDIVGDDVPVTDTSQDDTLNDEPVNLFAV